MFTPKKNNMVEPVSFTKASTVVDAHKICICKTFTPILLLCRVIGFIPLVSVHKNGRCTYQRSTPWLIYSILLVVGLSVQGVASIDFFHLTKNASLPILLNNITDAIYSIYIVLITALSVLRHPRWMRTLNRLSDVLIKGVFCDSARSVVLRVQYTVILLLGVAMALQAAVLTFLHFSHAYRTDFDYNFFINKTLQMFVFFFYVLFMSLVAGFIGILACFEKLTISCLKYVPIHPMKGINETNNTQDFFGFFSYPLCMERHPCVGRLATLPPAELVEFLRILHEEISMIIYDFNDCLNPQFLCHTVVELTILIIQWYAVIVYIAFGFKSPAACTIHVINCLFVVMHTLGMFIFLKNAQQLKNMIQGLNNFLLEYSTRITSIEEHQQVRLFIEKLKQHRPLTASGVFTIDLGIAGPISANILTYVLVALQFEIPKED